MSGHNHHARSHGPGCVGRWTPHPELRYRLTAEQLSGREVGAAERAPESPASEAGAMTSAASHLRGSSDD